MEIKLENQNGEIIDLSDFKCRKILFFYPKANTPGWTKETMGFGESYSEFKKYDTEIIGISKDPVNAQFKFAKKLNTQFNLLSYLDGSICEKFNVWQEKKFMGKKYMGIVRSTFLLDENNEIIKEWRNVRVKGHVENVLTYVKSITE